MQKLAELLRTVKPAHPRDGLTQPEIDSLIRCFGSCNLSELSNLNLVELTRFIRSAPRMNNVTGGHHSTFPNSALTATRLLALLHPDQ